MITAGDARGAAKAWVTGIAAEMPGYRASFLAGSTAGLPDAAALPAWSDTDVMIVVEGDASAKAGKFLSNGILLEGTFLSQDSLAHPEAVLGRYHLANAVVTGTILDDPTGWLADVQEAVRRDFARRRWVEARCANARDSVTSGFQALSGTASLAEMAQAWVFPIGVVTHILLVAGLRNPTVRRRYEVVHDLLVECGQGAMHERLLESLGSRHLTLPQVARHLEAVTRMFDAASPVRAGSYRFSSDVSEITRPISIDGSRDMIDRGYHREAVFWLVVTGSRALQKLAHGSGPAAARPFEPEYAELLADLGIASFDDVLARREQALALLPEVWHVAQGIMDAHPDIIDG